MIDDVFQRYGAYYDLLYRDKDYAAEVDYIARILRAADPNANKLLELGSGTGRHGSLLARRGFDVFGVERSESMVTAARTVSIPLSESGGGSFHCTQGDICAVKLDRVFDAVLALFHVVSYQTRNADVMQTFANVARHLRPRGVFLFDVWHGPAVLAERPSVRVKRVEDDHTRLIRIAEPELDLNASVVTVRYTMLAEAKTDGRLTTFTEQHPMRYFFPVEIDLLAGQAGFDVERTEEFFTGRMPSDGTWGVLYLLRKRG
jgi:SAM-dependent methyltransferase